MKISLKLRTLAFFLIALMVFYVLPVNCMQDIVSALSEETLNTSSKETLTSSTEASDNDTKEEAYVIGEDISKREENVKHFRMSDGSFVAVQYAENVHYLDSDGTYTEYDNTLSLSSTVSSGNLTNIQSGNLTAGNLTTINGFKANKSDVSVTLANNVSQSALTSINKGEYSVSIIPLSLNTSSKVVVNNTASKPALSTKPTIEEASKLYKHTSSVKYEGLFSGADLEYVLSGSNLKENIIVNEKTSSYIYRFNLNLTGLYAVLNQDGSISLIGNNTDKVEFTIPAGYMFDANGQYSDSVTYSLTSKPNGNYTLTVTADSEWINSEDRAFPVTIDPTLFVGIYGEDDNVSDTYVASNPAWADDSNGSKNSLVVGYVNTGILGNGTPFGTTKTYVKIDVLPEVSSSSVIVSAELMLRHNRGYQCSNPVRIGVKEVTNEVQGSITWNNQPTVSDIFLDYETVVHNNTEINKNVSWDITAAVKKWYNDSTTNKGLWLEELSGNTSENNYAVFLSYNSTEYNSQNGMEPMFKISYRDTKGIDSRWSYSSFGMGNSGTGNINLFNGNLVVTNSVMSTNGNILPVIVTNVYNTYLANSNFDSSMKAGYGWQLSVQEKMQEVTISGTTYIKYTTATGTELYFQKFGDLYYSEDGYPYYITKNSSGFELTDDYGNVKSFNSSGKLTSIEDSNGNKKYFTYSSNKLTYIYKDNTTSTSNRLIKFEYNSSNYLKKITNLISGDYVEYFYSTTPSGTSSADGTKYLRQIHHSDGYDCYYNYDANGLLISSFDVETAFEYDLEYDTFHGAISNKSYRVKKVTQISSNGSTSCAPFQIEYDSKKTSVRTWGTDEILLNADDIISTYVFDSHGRTISAYSTDVTGKEIYGASNAVYSDVNINNGGVLNQEYKKNNKIKSDSISGYAAMNLLNNGNLESTAYWTTGVNGTDKSASAVSTEKFLGNKSLSLTSDGTTGYIRRFQSVTLDAGTYTLSAYVKTVGVSGDGAYLKLGNYVSEKIKGTTNETIENGWKRIYVTATLEAGTYQANMYLENAAGNAYFDCVQLEKATAPSSFNLVDNGNMEKQNTWSGTYAVDSDRGTVAYVTGDTTSRKYSAQSIYLGVDSDTTTFVLKGWGKADSATLINHENEADTTFGISAKFYLTDKTTGEEKTEEHILNFNPTTNIWQYGSKAICFETKNATVDSVDVILSYDFNVNSAWFDDVSLTLDPAQTYAYDANGNITKLTGADGNEALSEYENEDLPADITKYTNIYGEVYSYEYNVGGVNPHQVKKVSKTSANKTIETEYTYDEYGNVTSTKVSPSGSNSHLTSSQTYSNNGNYISSITDANNITYEYLYNPTTNLLTLTKDGLDNTTRYVYDGKDRITSMFNDMDGDGIKDSSESGVDYSYTNNGYLSQIQTASTAYVFSYDSFGNNTSISISGTSSALATYVYGANNGKLQRTTYGNGTYVENVYDHLDRIVAIKYNGDVKYTFKYNGDGQLASCEDLYTNYTYTYEYDSLGRLIRGMMDEPASTNILMTFENQYDSLGRPSSCAYVFQGKTVTYSYSYLSNFTLVDSVSINCNGTVLDVSYTYDNFNRLSQRKISCGTNILFHDYHYSNIGSGNGTLIQEVAICYKNGLDSINYIYTYDANGNITQIRDIEGIKQSYEYDSLNQLIRENDEYSGKTYVYEYDSNGNILTKKTYAYTTGSLGSLLSTITYTYGDEAWGDLLTNYNGTNITYDEIGNPLNWHNVTSMTWEQGRRLKAYTYTKDGNTYNVTLHYNQDGIRIGKITINANDSTDVEMRSYTVEGTNILCELVMATGSSVKTLYYIYDASGEVIGFKYGNRSAYYYGKNAQGDVVALFDSQSQLLARYYYDAWGNVTSIKDANGNEITSESNMALVNPIRYRSYYYDSDTNFYYLNSRYYDSTVGRFINADVYVSTGQGVLGCNMFAYCGNNPAISYDPYGEDAIVLTNDGMAGHTGIMAQDENGVWYHFYWGAGDSSSSSSSISSVSIFGCKAKTWCKKYEGKISLEDINASGQYAGTYDRMERLYGDFSSCIDKMENASGKYNLYSNNCLDKSFSILASADTIYKDALLKGAEEWRPEAGHDTLLENMPIHSDGYFLVYLVPLIKRILERCIFNFSF